MLEVKCYGFKDKSFKNDAVENSILEINVDGTTGYLKGKQLTTIGSNKKNFFTFRNIPFAKEPERFMVQFAIEFLIIITSRNDEYIFQPISDPSLDQAFPCFPSHFLNQDT